MARCEAAGIATGSGKKIVQNPCFALDLVAIKVVRTYVSRQNRQAHG